MAFLYTGPGKLGDEGSACVRLLGENNTGEKRNLLILDELPLTAGQSGTQG